MKLKKKTIIHSAIIIGTHIVMWVVVLYAPPLPIRAAEMKSSNFTIESSSVNVGGGSGRSDSYRQESTVGEIGTGEERSGSYILRAGFQQLQETSISITAPTDVSMSASISGGTGGGSSDGSATWTVTTDSSGGYTLGIKASSDPALLSASDSFADYTPATAGTPDYSWSVSANVAEFGFSPEGTDIASKFKDNGLGSCGVGSTDTTDTCWYNLSTTNETIASRNSGNIPDGSATTVKFMAESGASKTLTAGTYTATITVTATAL